MSDIMIDNFYEVRDGIEMKMHIRGSDGTVSVDLYSDNPSSDRWYWDMYLQRRNNNGQWVTIATRDGYVHRLSMSHRVFYNVMSTPNPLRVRVAFDLGFVLYSDYFTVIY